MEKPYCPIPYFLSPVAAGFPSHADDYSEQALDLNDHLIQHPAATFFVQAGGDSMEGVGIRKGDTLIVDRALEASDGKIVVAVLNGDFTVKRLRIEGEKIFLQAENPNYPILPIEKETDFQVWGVVTYVIHKL